MMKRIRYLVHELFAWLVSPNFRQKAEELTDSIDAVCKLLRKASEFVVAATIFIIAFTRFMSVVNFLPS